MAKLILDSLEIRNFRAFRHLQIERLGRVNLITGRNNVGKSCLLEALNLYASGGSPLAIRSLLMARDEIEISDEAESIKYLFHGRTEIGQASEFISIGPVSPAENILTIAAQLVSARSLENGSLASCFISARRNEQTLYGIDLIDLLHSQTIPKSQPNSIPVYHVPPDGMKTPEIQRLWDSVALSSREEDVLNALRLIAPQICRVNLVGEQKGQGRIPMISLEDSDQRLSLKSLGDGVNRLFGIALALVNAKDGFLLLDEVENGIHYSALAEVWDFIFEVASRLNVQVFATTHGWDCIRGFQQSAKLRQDEGILIRLREKKGNVETIVVDENELEVAVNSKIEVRG